MEMNTATPTREMTYGEKAVGLNFNPANDPNVQKVKELYAEVIGLIANLIGETQTPEQMKLHEEAIRQAQTAQMWAVKAITYQF